jgi:hypothetical protein
MAACRVEEGSFLGWRAAHLENGLVRLVAVPDIGGRIMAYDLGPYAYLYVDRQLAGRLFSATENQGDGTLASWKNYGGDKTWPAPQGWANDEQWHGPPDPVLDTGRYRMTELDADETTASVRMVSPDGSPTGIRIAREATLYANSTRVTLDLSFHNVSNRSVRWSIWDVVQLRAERTLPDGSPSYDPNCVLTAPLNPESRFPDGYEILFGGPCNSQWNSDPEAGLFFADYHWEIGKVGLDSRGGWAAFANKTAGYAFAAQFPVFPDQEYPDDGADVEFWTVGRGQVGNLNYEHTPIYLMECEVLSPYYHMAPDAIVSFRIEWGACRCPGPIVDVTAAGCVGQKLNAARQGGYVHLKGAFGVFDEADLALVWKDQAGHLLEQVSLGPASPLDTILLDQVRVAPEGANQVELVTFREGVPLTLATTEIQAVHALDRARTGR